MNKSKKIISLLIALIVALSVFNIIPLGVSAAEAEITETGATSGTTGDCTWSLDNGVLTISGEGAMNHYDQQISPWRELEFTKVVIEDGVTSIGKNAFANCYYLESVSIGKSVSIIYREAFTECDNLKSVSFSNGLKEIGSFAFSNCPSLVSIIFPDSIETINYSVFWNCPKLTSVSFPAGIISIANESLGYYEDDDYQLTKVKGFTIYGYSNSVAEFYANRNGFTFSSRGRVTSGITGECTWKLNGTELTVSGNGRMRNFYYDYSYWGKDITKLTIANGVTSIGSYCFSNCTKLTSVTIANSVTEIKDDAFANCTSLKSLRLPASVTNLGDYGTAFDGCGSLTSIIVDAGNTNYDSRANCNAIIDSASNVLIRGCENTVIPDSVVRIGNGAFSGCGSLSSINIPNSVVSIGSSAFYGCDSLSSISIPDSVTEIWNNAFRGCSSLTKVTIPRSVTRIDGLAFADCTNLKAVTIPESVTDINYSAFGYYYKPIYDEYGFEYFDEMKVIGFTIYGKKGSDAERYANDNGFTFMELGSGQITTVVLGDANGDGEADAIDATIIQRYATMISVPYDKEQLMAGDVDGDGDLTVLDATYIQRFSTMIKVPYAIGEAIA